MTHFRCTVSVATYHTTIGLPHSQLNSISSRPLNGRLLANHLSVTHMTRLCLGKADIPPTTPKDQKNLSPSYSYCNLLLFNLDLLLFKDYLQCAPHFVVSLVLFASLCITCNHMVALLP